MQNMNKKWNNFAVIPQISTCLKATLWWLHWSVLTWIFWTDIETSWENNFFFDNNFLWAFHKNSIAMQEDKKNIPIKLPYKFNCLQYYMTHWKRPWCWERLKVGGEGDNGGWDSWMASLTQWRWVWINSRSWLWTGKPDMLQSLGSQRGGYYWVT